MRNFIQTAVIRVLNAKRIAKAVVTVNGMVVRARLLGARLIHASSDTGGHLCPGFALAASAFALPSATPRAFGGLEPAYCGMAPMPLSWRSTRHFGSRTFTLS